MAGDGRRKTSRESTVEGIIEMAGELDDRWLRGKAGLKPSTTRAGGKSGHRSASAEKALGSGAKGNTFGYRLRAKGNATGNARGTAAQT